MFLRRALSASRLYSSLPIRSIAYSRPDVTKPIDVTLRKDLVSFTFHLSGERPMNFFVSPAFSFKALQETIMAQYPNADFYYDFSGAQQLGTDESSNIYDFLNGKTKGQVVLHLNQDDFVLNNIMGETLSQVVLPLVESTKADPGSVIHWYNKCLENKVQLSQAGVLAYYLRSLYGEFDRQKAKGRLAETEIQAIVKRASVFGKEPIEKKLEECYHELNVVASQIADLEKEKGTIESKAERRINLYLKLIVLATVIQFVAFYYAIFYVEWLGWDIIEPITYTVQCLTVFFGLRFYMRYGLGRDLETIKILNRTRVISKDKLMKARYQLASQQLANKQAQKNLLLLQRDLYLNRRNYYQFFFAPTEKTQDAI